MNYYDEEILIPEDRNNSNKVEKNHPVDNTIPKKEERGQSPKTSRRSMGSGMEPHTSVKDDLHELLGQDIDDDEDDEISNIQHFKSRDRQHHRPGNMFPSARALDDDTELSESESDESKLCQSVGRHKIVASDIESLGIRLIVTPSKWEKLPLNQEIKDLFPSILKYAPQHIEVTYHLQPFIPDYIPAVGDVDAFLKVTVPEAMEADQQPKLNEHLSKLALHFLDEPCGQQSEPSVLYMNLRSVLSGSGNVRTPTSRKVPTAKTGADVDKWVDEVYKVHLAEASLEDIPLRKDVDGLLTNWPRSYADTVDDLQVAYQQKILGDITMTDYIRLLCEKFDIKNDGGSKQNTHIDYLLDLHTLCCLYLVADQKWNEERLVWDESVFRNKADSS